MRKVLGAYPVLDEGDYLAVYIPHWRKWLVFEVYRVLNRDVEVIHYGKLPIASGTTLLAVDGTTKTVPEDGVLPALSYVTDLVIPPSLDIATYWATYGDVTSGNILTLSKEHRKLLVHFHLVIKPEVIKVQPRLPPGKQQITFFGQPATPRPITIEISLLFI